jgi:hypothetical protein
MFQLFTFVWLVLFLFLKFDSLGVHRVKEGVHTETCIMLHVVFSEVFSKD